MSSPSPSRPGGTPDGTAILYVPGIHHESPERELDILAKKLARTLDQHAADGRPAFVAEPCQLSLGSRTLTGCRLLRRDKAGGATETVADLFELNYRELLLEPYRKRSLLAKILTVMLALAVMLPAACWRWFRPSLRTPLRTTAQRGHVAYALCLLAGVVLYLTVLAAAGVKVLLGFAADRPAAVGVEASAASTPSASISPSGWSPVGNLLAPAEAIWQWTTGSDSRLFVLLTSIALLVGPGLRDRIKRSAEQTVALGLYFGLGFRRPQLLGAFDEVIEMLLGQAGYTRCCLIAYSFGSILALDALFPPCERRAARLDQIETLVTIGSPHDLILTYWPRYFDGRHPGHPTPRSWVNVYLPADVLSSRFHRESGTDPNAANTSAAGLAQRPTTEMAFLEVQPDELVP